MREIKTAGDFERVVGAFEEWWRKREEGVGATFAD